MVSGSCLNAPPRGRVTGPTDCFVAWVWKGAAGDRRLVAVNYAANQSQCYVRLPLQDLGERSVRFVDLMGSAGTVGFDRERSDLDARGL